MDHLPFRPSWDCDTCEGGKPWPCDPAREALAAEYLHDRVALAVVMWSYLEDFVRDAGPGPFGEAYERFMAWWRRKA